MAERMNRVRGGRHYDPYAARREGRILLGGRSGDVDVHLCDCGIGSSVATDPLV